MIIRICNQINDTRSRVGNRNRTHLLAPAVLTPLPLTLSLHTLVGQFLCIITSLILVTICLSSSNATGGSTTSMASPTTLHLHQRHSSNMILQRDAINTIEGWAGESEITIIGCLVSTTLLMNDVRGMSLDSDGQIELNRTAETTRRDLDQLCLNGLKSVRTNDNTDSQGYFKLFLPPQPTQLNLTLAVWSCDLRTSSTSAASSATCLLDSPYVVIESLLFLTNLVVGDVYLCSGQSNMEMPIVDLDSPTVEYALSQADQMLYLRHFTLARALSSAPLVDLDTEEKNGPTRPIGVRWSVSSRTSIAPTTPDADAYKFSYLSATCFFYALELYQRYNNDTNILPIGIIVSSWGGTHIAAWMSEQAITSGDCPLASRACSIQPFFKSSLTAFFPTYLMGQCLMFKLADRIRSSSSINRHSQSALWNGMLAPLLGMSLSGVLWYQGESDAGASTLYSCLLKAFIQDLRHQFIYVTNRTTELPFFLVSISSYDKRHSLLPYLRQSQLIALTLPDTGIALSYDLLDPDSPYGDIHPRTKQPIGHRLSLLARRLIYRELDLEISGPTMWNVTIAPLSTVNTDEYTLRIRIIFLHSVGWYVNGTLNCRECCQQAPFQFYYQGTWYELNQLTLDQTPIQVTPNTNATTLFMNEFDSSSMSGRSLLIDLPMAGSPPTSLGVMVIQMNWYDSPQCTIYNQDQLPALPFKWTN